MKDIRNIESAAELEEPQSVVEEADDEEAESVESDEDILKQARKDYAMCQDSDGDNRTDARDDLLFLTGGENQWDSKAVAARKLDGRPIITVNDLPSLLHQVTNDQRMNRPSIRVHPVDSNADIETAKVIQGMIRHIEYDSNADVARDRAVNSSAAIGFGYWRFVTEYEDEKSFNQKIMFKSVRNALSVRIDPLAIEPDGSDMNFAFLEDMMRRDDFKRKYPDAKANDSSIFQDGTSGFAAWLTDNTVLVCEYYRLEKVAAKVVLLSNGESGFKDDLIELPPGVTIMKERDGERRKVMWYRITATDVLDRAEIKCKWIPVFPVYGDEIDVEGKVYRSGVIRNAKGPAQSYNVMITAATEEVASRAKAPWIMAEGQEEGHEDEFSAANSRQLAFITYKPTSLDGKLTPAPSRVPTADIPSGMLAMAMHAQENKKRTTGLFDASLGARGSATSGKQELIQQREGDVANFHYQDGLLRTNLQAGRCLVDMIPHYYDGARTIRILGEDETAQQVKINQPFEKKDPKTGAVETVTHDLTVGTYDVTVSAGPSYSTKRQEAAEFLTAAMQAAKDPRSANVITYLAFRNQDMAGADEATRMLKKLLPPEVAEPEQGDDENAEPVVQTPEGPMPISKVGALIQKMGQALQNADKAVDAAELLEKQNKAKELQIKEREAETKQYAAETDRKKADAELLKATNESKTADAALQAVSISAAREAVSLVGTIAQQESMQPVTPMADPAGGGLQPPAPPAVAAAAEQPPVPM